MTRADRLAIAKYLRSVALEQLRALLKECVPYLDELAESLQCEDLDDDADMVSKLGSRIVAALRDKP